MLEGGSLTYATYEGTVSAAEAKQRPGLLRVGDHL